MLIENYSKKIFTETLDADSKIILGGKDKSVFEPALELRKWDEISLYISLKTQIKQIPVIKGDVLETNNLRLYKLQNNRYEYQLILSEKPSSNEIEFFIETDGLTFLPQPKELSAHELSMGNGEIIDGIRMGCYRPDDVKGSIAVYMDHEPVNIKGGKVYGRGKVAHLFRPKLIDAKGYSVWGDISVNVETKTMKVIMPEKFWENATYPIRHAAGLTAGWTGEGGTSVGVALNRIYTYEFQPDPGISGDISKLTMWLFAGAVNYKAIIIDTSGGTASTILSNGVGTATADGQNWVKHVQDLLFGTTKPKFGSNSYALGIICDGSVNTYYDVSVPDYIYWDTTNSYTSPEDFSNGALSGGYKGSSYATYEAAPVDGSNLFFMYP